MFEEVALRLNQFAGIACIQRFIEHHLQQLGQLEGDGSEGIVLQEGGKQRLGMQVNGAGQAQAGAVLRQWCLSAQRLKIQIGLKHSKNFALDVVAGDIGFTPRSRFVGIEGKEFRSKRGQFGACVALVVQVVDQIFANGKGGGIGKRRLVEGDGFLIEEHAHQRGQAAAQAMTGEADDSAGRVGGFDLEVIQGSLFKLAGTESSAKTQVCYPVAQRCGICTGIRDDDFACCNILKS